MQAERQHVSVVLLQCSISLSHVPFGINRKNIADPAFPSLDNPQGYGYSRTSNNSIILILIIIMTPSYLWSNMSALSFGFGQTRNKPPPNHITFLCTNTILQSTVHTQRV
jgi:hypothetical protein